MSKKIEMTCDFCDKPCVDIYAPLENRAELIKSCNEHHAEAVSKLKEEND